MEEYEIRKEVSGYVRGHQIQMVFANSEEEAIQIARDSGDWSELEIVRDDTETQDIWCIRCV